MLWDMFNEPCVSDETVVAHVAPKVWVSAKSIVPDPCGGFAHDRQDKGQAPQARSAGEAAVDRPLTYFVSCVNS